MVCLCDVAGVHERIEEDRYPPIGVGLCKQNYTKNNNNKKVTRENTLNK